MPVEILRPGPVSVVSSSLGGSPFFAGSVVIGGGAPWADDAADNEPCESTEQRLRRLGLLT